MLYQTQILAEQPAIKKEKTQGLSIREKISSYLALFIVFLMYEGFYILPTSVVVPLPGQFRIADMLALIILLTFSALLIGTFRVVREHPEAALFVFVSGTIFCITVLIAQLSFGQPFFDGLLYIRHSFNYFLFFPLFILLSTEERTKYFLRIAAIFVACLAVLALLQKANSSLPIFNYHSFGEEKYSDIRRMRLGDYRLFFPHIEFALLAFFMNLSEMVNRKEVKWVLPKAAFLCLIAFVLVATGTRSHLITVILVSLIACLAGAKRWLKTVGVVFFVLCLLVQTFSFAVSRQGVSLFSENKVARTLQYSMDTTEGSIQGRLFQCKMYWKNFLKSPVLGVGTLRYSSRLDKNYRRYGMYNNNDLGYMKILAEYGLVGIVWVFWFYYYVYRRAWKVIKSTPSEEKDSYSSVLAKGALFFTLYVAISMLTLPHMIEGKRIIPIVLAMVFLETAWRIRSQKLEFKAKPGGLP